MRRSFEDAFGYAQRRAVPVHTVDVSKTTLGVFFEPPPPPRGSKVRAVSGYVISCSAFLVFLLWGVGVVPPDTTAVFLLAAIWFTRS